MVNSNSSPIIRLLSLTLGLSKMPPGPKRILVAVIYGLFCQTVFVLAVCVMLVAMFLGMTESFGTVSKPWSCAINLLLLCQFPLLHSVLLRKRGHRFLNFLAPSKYAETLYTTCYRIFASVQLLALFILWTPTGVVLWRAEVQSGALGRMSMAQNKKSIFPDMPTEGLFSIIRQPIYVSFALTLWTGPVWTPDQLALAIVCTTCCLFAPKLKKARFEKRYGAKIIAYRDKVPYALPYLSTSKYHYKNL